MTDLMDWSGREEIEQVLIFAAFLPLPFNVYCLAKHGHRNYAWRFLILHHVACTVQHILQYVGYKGMASNINTFNTIERLLLYGLILQSVGTGLLVAASVCFYKRAVSYNGKDLRRRGHSSSTVQGAALDMQRSKFEILHLGNILATVLIVIGLLSSKNIFDVEMGITINILAKIGSLISCLAAASLLTIGIYYVFIVKQVAKASHMVSFFVFLATILLGARIGYSTYQIQQGDMLNFNMWVQISFLYFTEFGVDQICAMLGLFGTEIVEMKDINRRPIDGDTESAQPLFEAEEELDETTYGQAHS